MERLSTGISSLDSLLAGGIPEGFFVALVGMPGTGKTIACLHFINAGLLKGEKAVYVTTEESRESIVRQASQFNMNFDKALRENRLIIIDALMRATSDEWTLNLVTVEEMLDKVIQAKKLLGSQARRLVIDSMSAFWLRAPVKAREESYLVKRVLAKWDYTVYATSQYAITTGGAFGWGLEHIADGIIHFKRRIINGTLTRYLIVEKMRQTPHDLRAWEISIVDGQGLTLTRPLTRRVEDEALPDSVAKKIKRVISEEEH
ncbi:MAG: KaiC domain-containing protein [Infirmifilum sp.]|uniref:Circadian clock protein KaiC n=1 Tax=Infirmifilum uzonense TaxID=1550241 RepID=A0A0F7FIN4_9CREN|nr:KaiC domain-containing protein [Infirmifilum uzonense]AKG38682.1 circadian clock protein KaiC [Infirmifilum uzonense]